MGGCFGNHPFDRHMENELFRYLDEQEQEFECPVCGAPVEEEFATCDNKTCKQVDNEL